LNRHLIPPTRKKGYLALWLLTASLLIATGAQPALAGAESCPGSSCFAVSDGIRVHYQNHGQGQEALVFVHGLACDLSFWRSQIPVLAKERRVIAVDLPGHGQSDKPPVSYTQDLFARGLAAVLDKAGVDQAVLIGHSMGLPVARQFIRQHPDRAKALVSVDGALFRVPKDPEELEKWKKKNAQLVMNLKMLGFKEFAGLWVESMLVEATPDDLVREIKSKMQATPQHVVASAFENLCEPDIWSEEPVQTPTLAIYAQNQHLPPNNESYLRRLFPKLKYQEWPEVSHFLMMEKPEKFNQALLKYLAGLN